MIKFCLIFQLYSSPRQCTKTMKMKLSSFGNIFTPLLKELNPPPESLHISVRNTVFQDIWLLLPRFSHSSIHVYLCHIRIESSWFQQQAICKLQLVKYLQFDAANSMKTSFQYLTKKTCLRSSSGLLQRRSVSVKTQTWQAVLGYHTTQVVFRTLSIQFILSQNASIFQALWMWLLRTYSQNSKIFQQLHSFFICSFPRRFWRWKDLDNIE